MEFLKKMRENREEKVKEMENVLNAAKTENRAMTAEEQEDYVSAMKKLVQYKLDSTALVIENDFYGYVFGNG